MANLYYFDVGANDGSSLIEKAEESADNIVYAFEPTPQLVKLLEEKTAHLQNYRIIPKAVADYNGRDKFYIAGNNDWGASSLYTFNDNLHTTWPGRTDLNVTQDTFVDVTRLDTFIEEHGIDRIEHLHIDAQGKDMEVLFGLGKFLSIVKEGVMEMPLSHQKKLYKHQKYIADDAILYLKSRGFEIEKINPSDFFFNECNIYFRQTGRLVP